MVKFLVHRPVAVMMTVLAFSVLGVIAFYTMPVSLLPDIDIPVLKVKVYYPPADARTLENSVVVPLRRQLMQTAGLKDLESHTFDGFSLITLTFSYATAIDYASLEVNEKIDAILPGLPRDMDRPQVIKTKPSDIPVFYISVVPHKRFYKNGNDFQVLSEYTESVVRRRLEQIEDVSMVDMNGLVSPVIVISPDKYKMQSSGIVLEDIAAAVRNKNIRLGNLSFRDGYFVYHLRVRSPLVSLEDFKNITLRKNGKMYRLGDITSIYRKSDNGHSLYFHNGHQAILLAVYKQAGARMKDIHKHVAEAIDDLRIQNPDINFYMERDQTKLLKYSLRNLQQSLWLGIILSMIILFLFIPQFRLPLIMSVGIPVSLAISFFFLYLSNISLNIISLSGLILSVGLMIDNSIIVIDNINQFRMSGKGIFEAAITGTNEVIRPLISSVLTTCAVFLPLIALSGIAGALFYDQAVTIAISLSVSLFVSIMVLPVLYGIFHGKKKKPVIDRKYYLLNGYENTLSYVMKRKGLFILLFFFFIPVGYLLFILIPKRQFPAMKQKDIIVNIEWNEPVTLNENTERTLRFLQDISPAPQSYSLSAGKSQFVLSNDENQSITSSRVYLRFVKVISLPAFRQKITRLLHQTYPYAKITFISPENLFRAVFHPDAPLAVARFRPVFSKNITYPFLAQIDSALISQGFNNYIDQTTFQTAYILYPQLDKLLLYNVNFQSFITKLKSVFNGYFVSKIPQGNKTVPIYIKFDDKNLYSVLNTETVKNKDSIDLPVANFLKYKKLNTLRCINSDRKGEYYGVDLTTALKHMQLSTVIRKLSRIKNKKLTISGSLVEQKIIFNKLLLIASVSIVFLYLILAAQFESLILPLIILLEISFDIAGALFFLFLFHSSLNIMSALGIIIMSGIVINDSILKIDTIQQLFQNGKPLTEAIIEGGRRRFYPIVMTSLTTVLALIPLMFYGGLGVELQLPLALSIIGGLTLGTLVSLFFIPIMFYFINSIKK